MYATLDTKHKNYQNLHITSTSCTFDDLLIISLDTEQIYEPESPTSTLLIIIVEFTEVNIFPSFIHEYERVPLPLAIHCRMTSFPRKMSLCGEMISFGMLVSMKYGMKKSKCINTAMQSCSRTLTFFQVWTKYRKHRKVRAKHIGRC